MRFLFLQSLPFFFSFTFLMGSPTGESKESLEEHSIDIDLVVLDRFEEEEEEEEEEEHFWSKYGKRIAVAVPIVGGLLLWRLLFYIWEPENLKNDLLRPYGATPTNLGRLVSVLSRWSWGQAYRERYMHAFWEAKEKSIDVVHNNLSDSLNHWVDQCAIADHVKSDHSLSHLALDRLVREFPMKELVHQMLDHVDGSEYDLLVDELKCNTQEDQMRGSSRLEIVKGRMQEIYQEYDLEKKRQWEDVLIDIQQEKMTTEPGVSNFLSWLTHNVRYTKICTDAKELFGDDFCRSLSFFDQPWQQRVDQFLNQYNDICTKIKNSHRFYQGSSWNALETNSVLVKLPKWIDDKNKLEEFLQKCAKNGFVGFELQGWDLLTKDHQKLYDTTCSKIQNCEPYKKEGFTKEDGQAQHSQMKSEIARRGALEAFSNLCEEHGMESFELQGWDLLIKDHQELYDATCSKIQNCEPYEKEGFTKEDAQAHHSQMKSEIARRGALEAFSNLCEEHGMESFELQGWDWLTKGHQELYRRVCTDIEAHVIYSKDRFQLANARIHYQAISVDLYRKRALDHFLQLCIDNGLQDKKLINDIDSCERLLEECQNRFLDALTKLFEATDFQSDWVTEVVRFVDQCKDKIDQIEEPHLACAIEELKSLTCVDMRHRLKCHFESRCQALWKEITTTIFAARVRKLAQTTPTDSDEDEKYDDAELKRGDDKQTKAVFDEQVDSFLPCLLFLHVIGRKRTRLSKSIGTEVSQLLKAKKLAIEEIIDPITGRTTRIVFLEEARKKLESIPNDKVQVWVYEIMEQSSDFNHARICAHNIKTPVRSNQEVVEELVDSSKLPACKEKKSEEEEEMPVGQLYKDQLKENLLAVMEKLNKEYSTCLKRLLYSKDKSRTLTEEERKQAKEEIIDEIRKIGKVEYVDTLIRLLARVETLWTSSHDLSGFDEAFNMKDEQPDKDFERVLVDPMLYLMRPHSPQQLAIMLLTGAVLNPDGIDTKLSKPSNMIVQIETGQGKSLVLALTAICFAYMQLDDAKVGVPCYSRVLSERDHQAFEELFDLSVGKNKIEYSVFDKICEDTINSEFSIRAAVQFFLGVLPEGGVPKIQTPIVRWLLFDEVDVLLDKEFVGGAYRPGVPITTRWIKLFFQKVADYYWTNDTIEMSLSKVKGWKEYDDAFNDISERELLNQALENSLTHFARVRDIINGCCVEVKKERKEKVQSDTKQIWMHWLREEKVVCRLWREDGMSTHAIEINKLICSYVVDLGSTKIEKEALMHTSIEAVKRALNLRISDSGKIQYYDSSGVEVGGVKPSTCWVAYWFSMQAKKIDQRSPIDVEYEHALYSLNLQGGEFFYEQLKKNKSFQVTVGVTGSLDLRSKQWELLKGWDITSLDVFKMPSIYSTESQRKIVYEFVTAEEAIEEKETEETDIEDVVERSAWYERILNNILEVSGYVKDVEINELLKGVPVIAFFEDQKILTQFHRYFQEQIQLKLQGDEADKYMHMVYQVMSAEGYIKYTYDPETKSFSSVYIDNLTFVMRRAASLTPNRNGTVTLTYKPYTRGMDYKNENPAIDQAGGVAIVVTFLPENPSEEVQVNGRTARQGSPGTAKYILPKKRLLKQYELPQIKDETPEALYQRLRTKSDELFDQELTKIVDKVEQKITRDPLLPIDGEGSGTDSERLKVELKKYCQAEEKDRPVLRPAIKEILQEINKPIKLIHDTANIILAIDATYSMKASIEDVSATVGRAIMDLIKNCQKSGIWHKTIVRMQVIAYRNYNAVCKIKVSEVMKEDELRAFLQYVGLEEQTEEWFEKYDLRSFWYDYRKAIYANQIISSIDKAYQLCDLKAKIDAVVKSKQNGIHSFQPFICDQSEWLSDMEEVSAYLTDTALNRIGGGLGDEAIEVALAAILSSLERVQGVEAEQELAGVDVDGEQKEKEGEEDSGQKGFIPDMVLFVGDAGHQKIDRILDLINAIKSKQNLSGLFYEANASWIYQADEDHKMAQLLYPGLTEDELENEESFITGITELAKDWDDSKQISEKSKLTICTASDLVQKLHKRHIPIHTFFTKKVDHKALLNLKKSIAMLEDWLGQEMLKQGTTQDKIDEIIARNIAKYHEIKHDRGRLVELVDEATGGSSHRYSADVFASTLVRIVATHFGGPDLWNALEEQAKAVHT